MHRLLIASLASFSLYAADPSWVWWEAERPSAGNFPANAVKGGAGTREGEMASAGHWIGADGAALAPGLWLEYQVEVPRTGAYDLFVRKFWKHGPFRWRFDDQPWQEVGGDCTLLDSVELRTHCCINWVPAGSATVAAGIRTLRIELTKREGVAYFDAFCLSAAPFTPRGSLKPDAPWPKPPAGWFTWSPAGDAAISPIDLRGLNERRAGERGPVRAQGDRLICGDGKPLRLWGVNAGPEVWMMPPSQVDRLAAFLARRGINAVRLHGAVFYQQGDRAGEVDPKRVDGMRYAVAALAKQGIYSYLSIYFPVWLNLSKNPRFAGYPDKPTFIAPYVDVRFQEMYRTWWRTLLAETNPHAATPLASDSAVAICELVNEDSFFFWTFEAKNFAPSALATLQQSFGTWLAKRHGSLAAAFTAWGGKPETGDDVAAGSAGMISLYTMFNQRGARAKDTARFLAETQRRFYAEHAAFLKEQLGYRAVVSTSNWTTASERWLAPLEKWTYLAGDIMDLHGYFGGERRKRNKAFGIQPGDKFAADRALVRWDPANPDKPLRACDLPFIDAVWNGKPGMVSETTWMNPNRFRAEMPGLTAALSSAAGMDAIFGFALDSVPGWSSSQTVYWPYQTPTDIGQSPAAALIYRQALIREAEPVMRVQVSAESALDLGGMPARNIELQDLNRASERKDGGPANQIASADAIDIRAFAIGKVEVELGAGPNGVTGDLTPYIDEGAKILRSSTSELRWRWGDGIAQLEAPRAQGAIGFLGAAGPITLPDLVIRSGNEFAAILAVPLDGKPLATSGRFLLQIMTEQRNTGWDAPIANGWQDIRQLGGPPILVREIAGEVAFTRADAANLRVTAIAADGSPTGAVGTAQAITLRPDVLYYLIAR
jgi:hypothetical protein